MKKIFFCILSIFTCILVGCSSNNSESSSKHIISSTPIITTSSVPTNSISQVQSPRNKVTNASLIEPFDSSENWQGNHPNALIRGWSDLYMNGGGTNTRYIFFADGSFYYAAGSDSLNRLRYMDGTWVYENNTLFLEISNKIVLEGGDIIENNKGQMPYIDGGVLKFYSFNNSEKENLEISIKIDMENPEISEIVSGYIPGVIEMDNTPFYAVTGIDYSDILNYWDTYTYYDTPIEIVSY